MQISKKFIAESVVGGFILTYISGFFNSTPGQLVGATWYGLPITWIRYLVIGPQYNPWVVDYTGLVVDLIFWIVIVGIILYAAKAMRKKGGK